MELFIGCSSSKYIPKKYLKDCELYLNKLLVNNNVVFGACPNGLMGMSYNIAKNYKNKVFGIIPEVYKDDLLQLNCDKEELTESISKRTDKLIEYCDAIVFLPGGIGTTYELLATIEYKRNNEFDKPIIIYNSNNYFDKLLQFLDTIYNEKFTSDKVKNCYHISNSIEDTLDYLEKYFK